MKRIVFLTGAGISAESGIPTFRDAAGMWENYSIEDVCTAEAWQRHPERILDFYNMLRRKYKDAQPNEAHRLLAALERDFDVQVITQNVDGLHEAAGSSHVLHLHGEIMRSRSDLSETRSYPLDPENPDIHIGDKDPFGYQLRPHIVFFGEGVPNLDAATELVQSADIFVVIGTSLVVHPAAGLLAYVPVGVPIYYIDPKPADNPYGQEVTTIRKGAGEGMRELVGLLEGQK